MPRRAASEDEEMEDAEVKIQEDVVELNGTHLNGHADDSDDPDGLPYDPDQKVEDKRRLRAQYRQLLGEQDGMYASDASILVLITPRASHRHGKPHYWPNLGESETSRPVFSTGFVLELLAFHPTTHI